MQIQKRPEPPYDCLIIGGGIAGLQAAIQLGRYAHRTLVMDKGAGRSVWCRSYHNLLGWPEGVSGPELRRIGRRQAESLGVEFRMAEAVETGRMHQEGHSGETFYVRTAADEVYEARCLLFATGLTDRFPEEIAGLKTCLGLSVYVCPDCDGHEVMNKPAIVLGSGDSGAAMAMALTYFTDQLQLINHDGRPIKEKWRKRLAAAGISVIEEAISEIRMEGDGCMHDIRLQNGRILPARHAFAAFGGNRVMSDLARSLGVERMENHHILTDPRTKMTNVPGIWAAGDVAVHAEQVSIAMGEGSQAAIWIHKRLMQIS